MWLSGTGVRPPQADRHDLQCRDDPKEESPIPSATTPSLGVKYWCSVRTPTIVRERCFRCRCRCFAQRGFLKREAANLADRSGFRIVNSAFRTQHRQFTTFLAFAARNALAYSRL